MRRAILAMVVLLVTGAAASPGVARQIIRVDGSSTVYPITEAMAEEFMAAERGRFPVTVGISGSGGGFKKFCRGDTDISDASRPIKASEREACAANGISFIELPVALDALAVVINPRNDWADILSVAELRTIWEPAAQGKVLSWSQVRDGFPDVPLQLFGPGVDSGTYDYFTEAVVGGEGDSRGDFTASEDDNILVYGVADPNNIGALGFFGFAYYLENVDRLKAVAITNGDAEPVLPSIEAAKTGRYQPLSRPLFIYVNADRADTEGVRKFVEFYLDPDRARTFIRQIGYVPLPDQAYQLAQRNFHARHLGSAFESGAQVGVSIEDVLNRVASQ